jgi:o-succinylbenzoate synthase
VRGSTPSGGPTAPHSRRWEELGSERRVVLEAADLWMLELPMTGTVVTAAGEHRHRPLVMVRILATCEGDPVEGWGECAALADTRYDPEDVHLAFAALERRLLPEIVALAGRTGRMPAPTGLAPLRERTPETPMAFAALEMATADAHLRAEGRSFAELLGVAGRPVELGAVVGMLPSVEELADRVSSLAGAGYSRLKVKIGPGRDTTALEAAVEAAESAARAAVGARSVPKIRLQADANGAYPPEAADHLAGLDRFGLLCLEQPFGPRELAAHTRLTERMRTPISLDEGVHSRGDIARALSAGACSAVCLKPGRIGGLGESLVLVDDCADSGIPLWLGGMFESGYARGVNMTLAALPAFTWPGDASPAGSYLGADLVPPPELERDPVTGALVARLPDGPGLGPAPGIADVVRLAVRHIRLTRE